MTIVVTVGGDGASGEVTVAPARLTFTPADWDRAQTVTVNAGGDADRTDDAAMLTHGASGGGYGGVSIASVAVTVRDTTPARQTGAANRINAAVLPHVAAAAAAHTHGAVAARIGAVASGSAGPALRLGALPPMADQPFMPLDPARPGPSLAEVLDGASFTLAALGPGASGDGTARAAALWGGGERLSLSGSQDGVIFDGTLWSAQLGADVRLRPDLLAGLALSRTQGNVDAHTADGRVRRAHETVINAISPYAAWLLPDGSVLWASAGYGRGQVRVTEAGSPAQRAALVQWSAAAGGRHVLFEAPALFEGGTARLAVRGEGMVSRLRSGTGDGLAALTVRTTRLRLVLEGSYEHALGGEATLTPALEAGLRHDGGMPGRGPGRGLGAEAGASLTFRDPQAGVTARISARILAAHAREEWGVSALLRLDPGADGRGTFLTLGPSHGRTQGTFGAHTLFEHGAALAPPLTQGAFQDGAQEDARGRLEAEIGHGFGLSGPGTPALLTPWAGLSLAQSGERTVRLGARYRAGTALAIDIEGTDRRHAGEQSILLRGRLRW